ncbi:MAG: phage tail protein [Actinobacteria bacterium]|nr:phage tail protein [Actinomycetota bacterium]
MAIAGKGGAVYIGANKVAEIGNWSLDLEGETLETTSFDSAGWKEFIAGLKGWSGSAEGNWKVDADATGQKALQDALLNGTTVSLELRVNATPNKYSGSALVTKVGVEAGVDDKVSVSFDFQGTGALTYA